MATLDQRFNQSNYTPAGQPLKISGCTSPIVAVQAWGVVLRPGFRPRYPDALKLHQTITINDQIFYADSRERPITNQPIICWFATETTYDLLIEIPAWYQSISLRVFEVTDLPFFIGGSSGGSPGGGTPTGAAGGVLAGTYPNPTFASDMATQAELDALSAIITTSLAGKADSTDPRFSDSRSPTGAAGGVLAGTYPNPTFASDMATQAELDAAISTLTSQIASGSRSTLLDRLECWLDFSAIRGWRYDLHKSNHFEELNTVTRISLGSFFGIQLGSGRLRPPSANTFLTNNRSFSFYVRVKFDSLPASHGQFRAIVMRGDTGSNWDLALYQQNLSGTQHIVLGWGQSTGALSSTISIAPGLNTTDYYSIFGQLDADNNQWLLQVNNASVTGARAHPAVVTAYHLNLGADMSNANILFGSLSHFCWWNRILTAGERSAIVTAGLNQRYPGP